MLIAVPAAGQTTSPPGPWVLDAHAVTSAVPTDAAFYPTLASTVVPSRGFGADVGGHVYLFSVGPARVGVGASVMIVRATVTAPASSEEEEGSASADGQRLTLTMRAIAPQLSFNFGSGDGWSYLSAGLGTGSINTQVGDVSAGKRESGQLLAVNFGGGARWFVTPRVAFSLDLRAHQFAASDGVPRVTVFAVGAGLSFR